jgi:hypothetical protein
MESWDDIKKMKEVEVQKVENGTLSRLQHFQYENGVEGADSVERFPSSANGCSRRERSSLKQVLLICTAK